MWGMSNFVLLPIDGGCTDYDCGAQEICLPAFEDCDATPIDSLLSRCELRWNCNRCDTDSAYFIPFRRGEKIQIQTVLSDLASANREAPTATSWLTVGLYSSANNQLITEDRALFVSREIFGWNGRTNYQIFEIDTSAILIDCWYLKFTTSDGRELCSQDFQAINESCGEETLLIRGIHEAFDCNGFYYGEPVAYTGDNFKYDNSMRLWAGLMSIPGQFEKEKFGRQTVGAVIKEQYRIVLTQFIPPYIERLLLKTLLAAPLVRMTTVQDVVVEAEITSYSPRNRYTKSNMMLFNADLFIECSESAKKC